MKILHTSDLHIGKMINNYPLYDDTRYVLNQVAEAAEREKVDVVLLAGDIYDRSQPSDEAVKIFNSFLCRLVNQDHIKVLAIAGNHDSGVKLATYGDLFDGSDVGYRVAGQLSLPVKKVTLTDEFGPVDFWLFPFFTPTEIKSLLTGDGTDCHWTYDEAFGNLMEKVDIDTTRRNVAVLHQFVAGFQPSGYEKDTYGEIGDVAGIGNITADKFSRFDYVALGHIHRPQTIFRPTLRYSGSLLKYKESEIGGPQKEFIVFDLGRKGEEIKIKEIPVTPLHDVIRVTGEFADLIRMEPNEKDYVQVNLTDETRIPNAIGRLSEVFRFILSIHYPVIEKKVEEGAKERKVSALSSDEDLLKGFYKNRSGKDLSPEALSLLLDLLRPDYDSRNEGGEN